MSNIAVFSDWTAVGRIVPPIVEHGSGVFRRVDKIGSADLVLIPRTDLFDAGGRSLALLSDQGYLPSEVPRAQRAYAHLVEQVRTEQKPSLLWRISDSPDALDLPGGFTVQTSLLGSLRRATDFAFPRPVRPEIVDAYVGPSRQSQFNSLPTVGFRGAAKSAFFTPEAIARLPATLMHQGGLDNAVIDRLRWNDGQLLRRRVMSRLQRDSEVVTDFTVINRGYWNASPRAVARNTARYVECLNNNVYSLCVRGQGNYSLRFAESVALGRVPLFIDTDCVLPMDDVIDWRNLSVWVDQDAHNTVNDRLKEFHSSRSGQDLLSIQLQLFHTYRDHLVPQKFWRYVANAIAEML